MSRIALFFLVLALIPTSLTSAQNPFSGAGIANVPFSGASQGMKKSSNNSQSTTFGRKVEAESETKSWLPWGRGDRAAKKSSNSKFAERPSWLPEPQSGKEDLDILDRAIKKPEKSMWARTGENMQQWAHKTGESFRGANQRLKESTMNTWENLTSKLPPPPWAAGNKSDQPSAKPPQRSASDWINQPKQKF